MKTIFLILLVLACLSVCGLAVIFLWVFVSNAIFKRANSPKIIWGSSQAEPFENQSIAEVKPCCSDNHRFNYPSQASDEQHSEQRLKSDTIKIYGSIPSFRAEPKKEFFGFVTQSGDFNGCQLYQCTICKQVWAYSEPDYAWRGFFKPVRKIEQERIRLA